MVVETLYEVQPISVAGVHPECIRILQYEAVESYPHCESKSGVLLSQMTSLAALAFPRQPPILREDTFRPTAFRPYPGTQWYQGWTSYL
eukprot:343255-Rhodomonas_salina.1